MRELLSRRARLVALSALVLALAHASTSVAGTYEVRACDAAPGYLNNSWSGDRNSDQMAVYAECPSGGLDTGLVTRHNGNPAGTTVPSGTAARWWFHAPGGAAIIGIRTNARFEQWSHGWQVGLSNGSQLILGCYATPSDTGGVCAEFPTEDQYVGIPPSGTIYTETYCAYGPCPASYNSGTPGHVWARAILSSAIVTIADWTAPGVTITGGGAVAGGWRRGAQSVSFDTSDNTGVKVVRLLVDGAEAAKQERGCDYTFPAPCPNGGGSLDVNTASFPDGRHTVTVQSTDAADNAGGDSRELLIDNTPPAQPESLSLDGGDGWRRDNLFRVTWTNPQENNAPISAAEYELCPAANAPGDAKGCQDGERAGDGIHEIDDLKVPAPGVWTLRLWLQDAAGNSDPQRAAAPLTLRLDQDPPVLAFMEQDAGDPARVRVSADDATSGITQGEIEIRRQGDSAWQPLAVELAAGAFSAVLDDEHMPDGTYELRARARDAAGNESSTDRRGSGAPAVLTLPVRIKTRLAVGKLKKVRARGARRGHRRARRILIVSPRARYGRTIHLHGRLTMPGANPVAGVVVQVSERVDMPGAEFHPIGAVTTTRTGRFLYRALRGPSRTLRFTYGGTPTIRSRSTDVDLHVRAATTIGVSRRFVVNGETILFHGHLLGGPIPAEGKLIELQVFARGLWRTFATTRAHAANGRWSYRYRFDNTRGRISYRFRARIRREATYPYTTGLSRRLRVTVQGI